MRVRRASVPVDVPVSGKKYTTLFLLTHSCGQTHFVFSKLFVSIFIIYILAHFRLTLPRFATQSLSSLCEKHQRSTALWLRPLWMTMVLLSRPTMRTHSATEKLQTKVASMKFIPEIQE